MAQLFLKGWIEAHPGVGEMRFNLPDRCTQVSVEIDTRGEQLDVTYGVETEDGINGTAWIQWTNLASDTIPFDYHIIPLDGDIQARSTKSRRPVRAGGAVPKRAALRKEGPR